MPLPLRLDWVIHRLLHDRPQGRAESRLPRSVAGVRLPQESACTVWGALLEHKWLMSERLGRDVGLRVAALDYFENVQAHPRGHGA